jgi:ribosomal protein S20
MVDEPVEPEAVFDLKSITSEEDESKLEKKISSALKRIKEIIAEKEQEGHDVSDLTELYRQCGNVFASDDLYTAVHYLESIQAVIDKMPAEEVGFALDDIDDDVFDGTIEVGGLDDGVVVLEEKPPEDVDHFELEDKPKMGDKEKAIHALESAKSAITDADEDGYDTARPKKLLREARPLYEARDFKAVIDKVREVEREILRIKGHSEKEIEELLGELPVDEPAEGPADKKDITAEERATLSEMINKTWVRFKEAEKYGIDTGKYKIALEKAKSKRTFKEASAMVEAVGKEVKDKLSSYHAEQHEKASNRFHYVRSEIQGAAKLGIDVAPYQQMLDRASSSISRSDYDDAMFTMDKCLGNLKVATDAAQAQAQAQAGATVDESVIKIQPVWDADDDEPEEPHVQAEQKGLTDEERLKILEDRFILGEISEASYRELKDKLLQRMGR